MGFSAERRRNAAQRLALVVVAGLAASAFTTGPETTTAMLTSTATAESPITTRASCLGGEVAQGQAYTSGLLHRAGPSLRWSFSDGRTPGTGPSDGISTPANVARGLLQCDPADFPDVATTPDGTTPGALQLVQGGSAGLTVAEQPLTEAFTLLFWVLPDADAAGELASLSNSTGELVVGLSASRVTLSFPTGDATAAVSIPVGDPGQAHLVGVVVGADNVTLSVDGHTSGSAGSGGATEAASTATTWIPTGTPNALTVGARVGHPSAGALVDEVTLLTGPATTTWLELLVESDRWWLPAGWTVSESSPPTATPPIVPVAVPAEPLVVDPTEEPPVVAPTEPPVPAPVADPSSSPTATSDPPIVVEVLPPVVEPPADSRTGDDRRSKVKDSRPKRSR